jgi:hypothetical protein
MIDEILIQIIACPELKHWLQKVRKKSPGLVSAVMAFAIALQDVTIPPGEMLAHVQRAVGTFAEPVGKTVSKPAIFFSKQRPKPSSTEVLPSGISPSPPPPCPPPTDCSGCM